MDVIKTAVVRPTAAPRSLPVNSTSPSPLRIDEILLGVVFAREAFADGGLHETGEGGEHVDGRVDAFVVELAVDEDLAFGDVTCQIGNRVCDVVVGHGQDGNLCDGAIAPFDPASSFVD